MTRRDKTDSSLPATDGTELPATMAALLWLLVRCAEGDRAACTRHSIVEHLTRIATIGDPVDPVLRRTAAGLAVRWGTDPLHTLAVVGKLH